MTVARTCKRGAPALTRKETTYSLKASAEARVHPRVGEIFFFSSFPLSFFARLPTASRARAVVVALAR